MFNSILSFLRVSSTNPSRRPVLKDFVVTMHESTGKQAVITPRPSDRSVYCWHVHVYVLTTKRDRLGLIIIINFGHKLSAPQKRIWYSIRQLRHAISAPGLYEALSQTSFKDMVLILTLMSHRHNWNDTSDWGVLCHHDDVIKWKHFLRYWPFVRGIHRSPMNSLQKASHAELWCFLWSGLQQTVEQTIDTPVIWCCSLSKSSQLCYDSCSIGLISISCTWNNETKEPCCYTNTNQTSTQKSMHCWPPKLSQTMFEGNNVIFH